MTLCSMLLSALPLFVSAILLSRVWLMPKWSAGHACLPSEGHILQGLCTGRVGAHGGRCFAQGNLSEFVKKKPEARSYYELASAQGLTFVLPEPGFLEGVKTKDRPILKMYNVAYKCAPPPPKQGLPPSQGCIRTVACCLLSVRCSMLTGLQMAFGSCLRPLHGPALNAMTSA
jgi:hypothetical protein